MRLIKSRPSSENIEDSDLTSEQNDTVLHNLALAKKGKRLLKDTIFVGRYMERRYLPIINDYRDLIIIHESEKGLIDNINHYLSIVTQNPPVPLWLGYSCEQNCYQLWVNIPNIPFDQYWFVIKSIQITSTEVTFNIKMLRTTNIGGEDTKLFNCLTKISEKCQETWKSINMDRSETGSLVSSTNQMNSNDVINEIKLTCIRLFNHFKLITISFVLFINRIINDCIQNLESVDIFEMFQQSFKYIFLLIRSIDVPDLTWNGIYFIKWSVENLIDLIKFTGQYTIQLINAIVLLIRSVTPIVLKVMDIASKIIGGILIFLTMIWRDLFGRQPIIHYKQLHGPIKQPYRSVYNTQNQKRN